MFRFYSPTGLFDDMNIKGYRQVNVKALDIPDAVKRAQTIIIENEHDIDPRTILPIAVMKMHPFNILYLVHLLILNFIPDESRLEETKAKLSLTYNDRPIN